MNDSLRYLALEPIHRQYHHHEMTFAMVYAYSENFILPISHDEVVHGKGSMINKIPQDTWRQFATLRAFYSYMWAFPGKQLLFINWEKHRLFSRPFVLALSPETPFAEIIDKYITDCYSYHPDFARIDWAQVIWQNSNQVFTPDRAKSLKENGIGHKDLIRFTTPGLNGIADTGY